MEVVRGVHRFSHGVANFYVYEEDGRLLLIDSGVKGDWDLFAQGLASLGHPPSALSAVVLTHAHADHTGFAERARADLGRRVWVHQADLDAARTGRAKKAEGGLVRYLVHLEAWRTLFGLLAHGGVRIVPILEASTFTDGQVLDLPGRPRTIHLPGHTPGMTGLYCESARALFTGDALVTRNPLTGRRGPQIMPGGLNCSSPQALESLARIADSPATYVLPGHGDPWSDGAPKAVQLARRAGIS